MGSSHSRPAQLSDVIAGFARGAGPASVGELVARLALRIADRAEPVVATLNERIDDLEDEGAALDAHGRRGELSDVRRMAIVMRRHMFPQRDALSTLEIEDLDWLDTRARARLREATERVTRLAEELDAIRDRAQVVHDEIMDLRAEAMNRQMLLLSVVSAVFLPLGFITIFLVSLLTPAPSKEVQDLVDATRRPSGGTLMQEKGALAGGH